MELWVFTSHPIKVLSDRMGYTEVIEQARGRVLCDTCPVAISRVVFERMSCQSVVTNSSALATYVNSVPGVMPHFGRLKQCVDAAISGLWSH